MKLNWNIAVGLQILLENNGSLTFKEIAKNLGISKHKPMICSRHADII